MKNKTNRVYRVYLEKPSENSENDGQCYVCRIVAKSVVDLKKQCAELKADVIKYQDVTDEYTLLTSDEIKQACINTYQLDEIETALNFEN